MSGMPALTAIEDDPQHIARFIDASQTATDMPLKMGSVKTLEEATNRSPPLEAKGLFTGQSLFNRRHCDTLDNFLLSTLQARVLVLSSEKNSQTGALPLTGTTGHFWGDHLRRHPLVPTIRQLLQPSEDEPLSREARIQMRQHFIIGTMPHPDDLASSI